jgi:hypothetical protein
MIASNSARKMVVMAFYWLDERSRSNCQEDTSKATSTMPFKLTSS